MLPAGVLTPPASQDPTPRAGSVNGADTETGTASEENAEQQDASKDASETSSVKSGKSGKSQGYGTI